MTSSQIWQLADAADLVPYPADPVLASCVSGWWTQARSFGCSHAKAAHVWFVNWPQPEVLCGTCALAIHKIEKRCVYCRLDVENDDQGRSVVHESKGFVIVLSKAHHRCAEEASK